MNLIEEKEEKVQPFFTGEVVDETLEKMYTKFRKGYELSVVKRKIE